MSEQTYVFEATRANFSELVVGNSRKGPVLVDFWAAHAGPSLRQRELLLRVTHLEMILAGRDTRSADELTGVLEKAPDDAEARFAFAAAALTADDYDTALEQIAELVRRAPGYRKGLPRRGLMVLLDTLEPDDARVKRFRQALFDH